MQPTFTHESDFRQKRDFGQKINATFGFIGVHWRPLGRVLLYLAVPAALVHSILTALLQSQLLGFVRQSTTTYSSGSGWATQRMMYRETFISPLYYLNAAVSALFFTILILSVYGYLLRCLYPTTPGAPITVADVWEVVKRKFLGTFLSSIGLALIVGLGFVVLFIPGFYLAVSLSLFFVVYTVEGSDFISTISRCLSLTSGKWWSTFGLIFIMGLMITMVLFGIMSVFGIAMGVKGLLTVNSGLPQAAIIAFTALTQLLNLLVYPPLLLALAFQYFNLVERKEGLGLHSLIDQLGQAPTTAAPGASTYRPTEEGEY
jgi:hypothetical protein